MELYTHLDSAVVALADFLRSLAVEQAADVAPAAVAEFWQTNQSVASGLEIAQLAAAVCSAVFVFIIVVSVLGKRAVSAPAAAAASVAEVPAEPTAPGPLRSRWEQVLRHLDSPREADWKVAVMEADKIADDALARAGFPGESFGDRLTAMGPGSLASLDGLWWAHRIRNRVAHEMDYFLRYTEAKQAVGYFQQTLEELRLI